MMFQVRYVPYAVKEKDESSIMFKWIAINNMISDCNHISRTGEVIRSGRGNGRNIAVDIVVGRKGLQQSVLHTL